MRVSFGLGSLTPIMLAMLFTSGRVFAQGCDEGILDYTITCDTAPNGIVNASSCSTFATDGRPCYYCYQGSGDCVDSKKVDHHYYLANLGYDNTCSTCTGCCFSGCADPTHFACLEDDCQCHLISPIIIDTTGKGFYLTPAASGVVFDMAGDGHPIQMAWTVAGSGNAFLALDRNHNGRIDSGQELFGNFTEQPESDAPNGFLALAEFDKPENGGNGDGIIDDRDAVFTHLLLWIDANHDGVSQPEELHPVAELGVFSLSLKVRDDRHSFDQYGNWFHYQAAVNPDPSDGTSKDGRVAYDVYFLIVHADPVRSQAVRCRKVRISGICLSMMICC